MSRTRDTFNARMEGAQAAAMRRRNAGIHTGVSAKGWNWTRPTLDPADYQSHVIRAHDLWRMDKADAVNLFRSMCLNQRWEAIDEIPF